MTHNRIVTENQLGEWVRGNARDAQSVIVELVWRLVAASAPSPRERRFALGDSIEQPGPDGFLDTDIGLKPFVPEGRSFWEIGTGGKAGVKATKDYKGCTKDTPAEIRREATFVFVTPLSGRKDWPYTWKPGAQAKWLTARQQANDWRDVRVIDGSRLIDWLHSFPAVEMWLAGKMGLPVLGIETPERRWNTLRTIGDPPPLTPDVFLVNRTTACQKLKEVFSGTTLQLKLETHFPEQVADFISAFVASMANDARIDMAGRSLIISDSNAWNTMTELRERHTLVADFDLDEPGGSGTLLLERAKRSGHRVIYRGSPGGILHPNRAPIPSPKGYQIKEALEKAGYKEERARVLAQKTDGNLTSLLRCLQNLSLMPEWAQTTEAAELAIAELLGAWTERFEADKATAEQLSKKDYGEWIGKIHEISLRPSTPLIQRDGVWKVVPRYEGWYALGPRLLDGHLDRLREAVENVLRERDPKFELPPEERFAANVRGKVLTHSEVLRNGLAETIALLGSHPAALTSCSPGKAETTAAIVVREVLGGVDWVLWASLDHLLPLFAEAAPREFLDAVENALRDGARPFEELFNQERPSVFGANYMTGLLWAMETLAWDAEYLTRVVVILGELAARDPGGNWGNRPEHSLSTILLPWMPQTCASVEERRNSVTTLMRELPAIAWTLLLNLLPSAHQISSGSRRPAWRQIIPDDWSEGVTPAEYWEQTNIYIELAITEAKDSPSRLGDLIDRLDDLPAEGRDQILAHLTSDAATGMSETDRADLWTKLVELVSKHRKFADAEWAMVEPGELDKIVAVVEQLTPRLPTLRYRRLFSERGLDLYEEKGNYKKQEKQLEERRKNAIEEILATGGVEAILGFAKTVDSPWRVGTSLGAIAGDLVDKDILRGLIAASDKSLPQFAGGFIWGRFRTCGWQWVDAIDVSRWTPAQIGQFLAYLPFVPDAWTRAAHLLGEDESSYWTRANANPYATEEDFKVAIDRLVKYGRPYTAITCLAGMTHLERPFDSDQAVRVLLAALDSSEDARVMRASDVTAVIKALQNDPTTNRDALAKIEWAYLSLLGRYSDASPKELEERLSRDPDFFCEVIRLVFRSRKQDRPPDELTEQQKNIATNAYSLLHNWRTPPGARKDASFDGAALRAWLDEVKARCKESGHLEVALTIIGQVLVYAPADADGLWIHHSAAEVLNARDAEKMRNAFEIELFNSRGVHGFSAGRGERELTKKYRSRAKEVESRGYHRLAATLKRLAASYERDAEHEETRDLFDD